MAMIPQDWTAHALATEAGLHPNVVARRLRDLPPFRSEGKAKYWRLKDAGPLLFETKQPKAIAPDEERRLAAARAELAEIKVAKARGEVILVEVVEQELDRTFGNVRARLLAIPARLAPRLMPDDPQRASAILNAAVLEVLEELTRDDGGDDDADGEDRFDEGEEEASEPDDEGGEAALPSANRLGAGAS